MDSRIEILVHVSAPSRFSDDARYRREAQGLLNWEAVNRLDITSHGEAAEEHGRDDGSAQEARSFSALPPSEDTFGSVEQSFFDALETPNTRSAVSPQVSNFQTHHKRPILPPYTPKAALLPPRPAAASATPSVVEQTPLVHVKRTPFPPHPQTVPDASAAGTKRPQDQKTPLPKALSCSFQTPPSVIPDSQPTQGEVQEQPHDEDISSSQPSSPSYPRLPSLPPARTPVPTLHRDNPSSEAPASEPKKRKRKSYIPPYPSYLMSSSPPPIPLSSSSSSSSPRPRKRNMMFPRPADEAEPGQMPTWMEINPPGAVPSPDPNATNKFTTHLTPSLLTLRDNLPLDRFFRPKFQARALGVLERGYWRIPLPVSLPPPKSVPASPQEDQSDKEKERAKNIQKFVKLWEFLEDLVGGGGAGFAVWCCRETDERPKAHQPPVIQQAEDGASEQTEIQPSQAGNKDKDKDKNKETKEQQPREDEHAQEQEQHPMEKKEHLKIFTWGECLAEVWLMIWVGSDRTAAKWRKNSSSSSSNVNTNTDAETTANTAANKYANAPDHYTDDPDDVVFISGDKIVIRM